MSLLLLLLACMASETASTVVDCLTTPDGTDYRGHVSVTASGRVCQRWDRQWPHRHTNNKFGNCKKGNNCLHDESKQQASNYCRNPDNEKRPWCYTMDKSVRMEYCEISSCNTVPVPTPSPTLPPIATPSPTLPLSGCEGYSKEDCTAVELLVGNQYRSCEQQSVDVYEAALLKGKWQTAKKIWSKVVSGIGEVKRVNYLGQDAIMASTFDCQTRFDGAVVFSYPQGEVLFKNLLSQSVSTHPLELLPDGNIIIGDAHDKKFWILTREGSNFIALDGVWYPHSAVWDGPSERLILGGYLKLYICRYDRRTWKLTVEKEVSLDSLYESPDWKENYAYEDGIHDMSPYDDSGLYFLTTGERVFTYDAVAAPGDSPFAVYGPLFLVLGKRTSDRRTCSAMPNNKGGAKAISRDPVSGFVFAHLGPCCGARCDPYRSAHLVVVGASPRCGERSLVRFEDDTCTVPFPPGVNFYKARVFLATPYMH